MILSISGLWRLSASLQKRMTRNPSCNTSRDSQSQECLMAVTTPNFHGRKIIPHYLSIKVAVHAVHELWYTAFLGHLVFLDRMVKYLKSMRSVDLMNELTLWTLWIGHTTFNITQSRKSRLPHLSELYLTAAPHPQTTLQVSKRYVLHHHTISIISFT